MPGTKPGFDVKLVVWEHDWLIGREPVATVYFTDLMLSDDLDGMDYYEASAPDAGGGTDTFRISLNGVANAIPARVRKAFTARSGELDGAFWRPHARQRAGLGA